jgi:glycosyltransferase involved in cell wall biosynthesis
MRRALTLATRLSGTDGVSLEADKMARALAARGFETVDCAGEVARPGALCIPEMHFRDPVAVELGERAFGGRPPDPDLPARLEERARTLEEFLREVVRDVHPDLLIVQNAWAIPMQLPLARALALTAEGTGLPVLSHEHDYAWERERFAACRVPAFLERYFPYHGERVVHLSINGPARRELHARRGIDALLLPNVMDFDAAPRNVDAYGEDFREAAGLAPEQRLFLQPTRVVPRKGIERAVDLLAGLDDPRNVLLISHDAGDEGFAYLERLRSYALERGVDLRTLGDRVGHARGTGSDGRKRYALSDAYLQADFVTFPSLYEGFGNALLETVAFRRPALVNRFPVYVADIAPKGFRFVEIDGAVTADAVRRVRDLLEDGDAVRAMTEHNLALARRHYGLDTLQRVVGEALTRLDVAA